MDGVDHGDFFPGHTDRSGREGFPIFLGEKLYGAKWRNFNMLLVDQVDAEAAVLSLGVPRLYNLYTNPKEEPEHRVASTHLWVMRPIAKMIGEYQASLKQHPPIPAGIRDPYQPPSGPSSQAPVTSDTRLTAGILV